MMWLSIIVAAIIISDAIVQVNGFKPFMFSWTKQDEKEDEETEEDNKKNAK